MAKTKKKNSLLREAIADAKTVRETALANARIALEEAFTPQLTSMLATKLKNESDLENEETELEDKVDLEKPMGEALEEPKAADGYGSAEGGTTDKTKLTNEQEDLDSSEIGQGDNKKPDDDSLKSSSIGKDNEGGSTEEQPMGEGLTEDDDLDLDLDDDGDEDDLNVDMGGGAGDVDLDVHGGEGDEEDEDELGLEAVLRELEQDVNLSNDNGDRTNVPDYQHHPTHPTKESASVGQSTSPGIAGKSADGYGEEEPGGNTDKKAVFEDEDFDVPIPDEDEYDDHDDHVDLESIVREMENEERAGSVKSQFAQVKEQLREYRQAVKFLRSKLLEVNLLNAKLLFTNKLFKTYNMNVGQKMRVVENFDRATTLREVKLVYATLAESFRSNGTRRIGQKIVTEGSASKAVGSTKSTKAKALNEGSSSALRTRLQKLAGIQVL